MNKTAEIKRTNKPRLEQPAISFANSWSFSFPLLAGASAFNVVPDKMHRKKTIIIFATLLLIGASVLAALPRMIEWQGKRNTDYSSKYSNEHFDQIQVGMPAETVLTLIGEPISRDTQKDYPVWALRAISVRERLGKDSKFEMEVWSYSSPRNSRQDYELLHVAFGPSKEVIDKERWVTD